MERYYSRPAVMDPDHSADVIDRQRQRSSGAHTCLAAAVTPEEAEAMIQRLKDGPHQYRTKALGAKRDFSGVDGCIVCGQPIKDTSSARSVHIVDGGGVVLHPMDEPEYSVQGDPAGDCGAFPIGPECASRLGFEWSTGPEDGTPATDPDAGTVYFHVFVTKSKKFRAVIARKDLPKVGITVGGERWQAGELAAFRPEILRRCGVLLERLRLELERASA